MAEHDSIVDTEELLALVSRQMVNPQSRILWYGNEKTVQKLAASDKRFIVRTDVVPEYRVTSFSHMGCSTAPKTRSTAPRAPTASAAKKAKKLPAGFALRLPRTPSFTAPRVIKARER